MNKKTSIGAVQPMSIKWASFLFTSSIALMAALAFIFSQKQGYWVGLIIVVVLVAYTFFRTLNTANIYVSEQGFVIEHALLGTLKKESNLYKRIEDSYFYYAILFYDNTKYYFFPSLTGVWQSYIKDSQGYSNYVRNLVNQESNSDVGMEP